MDHKLNWEAQILTLKPKLSSRYFIATLLRNLVSEHASLNVYYFMFQCYLSFDVNLWRNSSLCISVCRFQKKIVKAITGATYHDICKPKFIRIQILTLPSPYIFRQLREINRNKSSLSFKSLHHHYNKSDSNSFRPPRFRLNKMCNNSLNTDLYYISSNLVEN